MSREQLQLCLAAVARPAPSWRSGPARALKSNKDHPQFFNHRGPGGAIVETRLPCRKLNKHGIGTDGLRRHLRLLRS